MYPISVTVKISMHTCNVRREISFVNNFCKLSPCSGRDVRIVCDRSPTTVYRRSYAEAAKKEAPQVTWSLLVVNALKFDFDMCVAFPRFFGVQIVVFLFGIFNFCMQIILTSYNILWLYKIENHKSSNGSVYKIVSTHKNAVLWNWINKTGKKNPNQNEPLFFWIF